MNIIIYIYTFLIGILFGSFFSLAIYRIPLGMDITHTRSYCPKCKHKLAFWDLIPIFSYIFLKGKCKYCNEKIRIRYFLLEIFSGLVFLLFTISINLNIINISKLVYLLFGLLYIAGLFIIAGIDKEKIQIQNQVLLYTIIIEAGYIIYLYIVENANIYRYVIYLFIMIIIIVINNLYFYKKTKNNYILEILLLLAAMANFTYEACTILTIIFTLLSISIVEGINKLKKIKNKNIKTRINLKCNKIPFGFYLSVTNIIVLIIINILSFYKG